MRPSCNRHVISVLRRELGMNQSDFAWLVGCSASHIQAVEIRRLPLTERVAMRIFAETGVSPDWLLANDFGQPMVEGGKQNGLHEGVFREDAGEKNIPRPRRMLRLRMSS